MVADRDSLVEALHQEIQEKDKSIDKLADEYLKMEERAIKAELALLRLRQELQRETVSW